MMLSESELEEVLDDVRLECTRSVYTSVVIPRCIKHHDGLVSELQVWNCKTSQHCKIQQ